MSDEDIYFGNEEEQENNEDNPDLYEEEILDTPEKVFDSATNHLGIDDYYSIDLFYKVYMDENSTDDMKKDSLKEIAKTISQHADDIERIINVLSDVFYAYQDGIFCMLDLNQTVFAMISNLSSSHDAFSQFLESAESQVEQNENEILYAEIKLRQLYLMMENNDIKKVEEGIQQIEPIIPPYTPEATDYFIRSLHFRLFILKIIIADEKHDEDKIIQFSKEAGDMNQFSMSTFQNAIFSKIQGFSYRRNRNFIEAKKCFFEAFKLFDDIGNDKRIDCLKYCALCEMVNHDFTSIFSSSKAAPFIKDENIVSLYQMNQAYINNDIAKFSELIEPVSRLFYDNKFDISLIYEIRKYVLRLAIWKFSRNYVKFELKYVAEQFSTSEEEITQLIMDLIISKDLNALLNPENNVVTVYEQFKQPIYLIGINQLFSTIETSIRSISNEEELNY